MQCFLNPKSRGIYCEAKSFRSLLLAHFRRFLLWLALIAAISATTAATYYVDPAMPNDTGNGSRGHPKKFLTSGMALMAATGGDSLVLAAGTYSGTLDSISRNTRLHYGKPGAYNVIKAAVDGSVVLTREFSLPLTSAYLQFEGLKWDSAFSKSVVGHHLKFLRCAFRGGPATGNAISLGIGTNDQTPGAQYVLIEDSWVYGPGGRYKIIVYNAESVVLRRVVVRHDAGWAYDGQNPQGGITIYNSKDVHLQNGLVIDSDLSYPGWGAGIYIVKNTDPITLQSHTGTRVRGSIMLNINGAAMGFDGLGKVLDSRIQDSVIWGATAGIYLNNGDHSVTVRGLTVGSLTKIAFGLYAGSGASLDVRNTIIYSSNLPFGRNAGTLIHQYNNCNANKNNNCGTQGETAYSPLSNGLKFLPRIEAMSILRGAGEGGQQVGATVTNRIGVSNSIFGDPGFDTLSREPLWPWPNEDRLKGDLCANGIVRGMCRHTLSLTDYVWTYLGTPTPNFIPFVASSNTQKIIQP